MSWYPVCSSKRAAAVERGRPLAGVFGRKIPQAERSRIATLLTALTGQDFGNDRSAWQRWLAEQEQAAAGEKS